jgi:mRNA interferase HicA
VIPGSCQRELARIGRTGRVRLADRVAMQLVWVIRFGYYTRVTASELKRKLAKRGCTFEDGQKHLIVYYRKNRTLIPRHPSQDIKRSTYYGILKRLGIRESEL